MFPSVALIATASLYFLAAVDAAPSKRQSDNGSCQALFNKCAGSVDKSLSNVFAIESCVFAATCANGSRPVDNFLAALFTNKNGENAGVPPQSVGLPRVTSTVLNSISTDGKTISQQDFINGYYGTLSPEGPWPSDAQVVINYYNRVAVWTAFCNSNIPFFNFQDYFQYSSSVSSNGCSGTTISTLPPTTTQPPPTSTPTISSDASCQKMFTTCINEVNKDVSNIFSVKSCVLGATCFGGQRPVAGFVSTVYGVKNSGGSSAPAPSALPRVSQALFNAGSTNSEFLTSPF
ncbi:hypothetical protein BDZ94DRAFT_1159702 [Collybia nuda]|uniref:Uncharacterized protein n=1 Tax=Collybia nuda TaxID=64659 RepID=A0A9P5YAA9_9AGAR|nr:hypothetical protein BDZ94DRAFT_1159702 [Collybia nuda]